MIDQDSLLEVQPERVEAPRRKKVLIIDDDRDQAEVLALRMTQQGFVTHTAFTAASGLAMAQRQAPDVILLDVRLPDGDGLLVCEQLADDPATWNIPVIIVSGMERPDIVRQARAAGCQYYVRKPYDPNALLVLVESAIAQR